jgi:hypothetical protein
VLRQHNQSNCRLESLPRQEILPFSKESTCRLVLGTPSLICNVYCGPSQGRSDQGAKMITYEYFHLALRLEMRAVIPPLLNMYSRPSNFERFDIRTTWNSNKKFEENPILKLEQRITWSRHVVGRLLSLLGRTCSCSVSSPVTGSVSISKIQSDFKRFNSWVIFILFLIMGYIYIIFNNTHS